MPRRAATTRAVTVSRIVVTAVALVCACLLISGSPARAANLTVTPGELQLSAVSSTTFSYQGSDPSDSQDDINFNGLRVASIDHGNNASFQGTFAVASGIPVSCGANSVTATTVTDGGSITVGSTSVTVDCSISLNPSVVPDHQQQFTVGTQNFPPCGECSAQLTIDGNPQSYNPSGNSLGFTAAPGCGTHQVTLANSGGAAASTQLTVLCPHMTLSPSSIPSVGQPTQVQVTLTGFHANQPVTITLGSATANGTTDASKDNGQGGGFGTQITASGLTCGGNQVAAAEQPQIEGGPSFLLSTSTSLQVTACKSTGHGKSRGKATVAVNPVVIEPGTLTHVTGSGFAPNRVVTLTWQLPDGTLLLGTLTVTANGGGRIDTYFMVMVHDQLGARELVATQGQTKARADAVVDGGPMQPSNGDRLIYRR